MLRVVQITEPDIDMVLFIFFLIKIVYIKFGNKKTLSTFIGVYKRLIKMDADIKGCLACINKSYKAFEHNGQPLRKEQVKMVLEYGLSKGYDSVSQISDAEVDALLFKTKKHKL